MSEMEDLSIYPLRLDPGFGSHGPRGERLPATWITTGPWRSSSTTRATVRACLRTTGRSKTGYWFAHRVSNAIGMRSARGYTFTRAGGKHREKCRVVRVSSPKTILV